ncbi:hypothetical protein TSTA_047860 [Talaromyces stipitatus ATCC 10500]|uniref:Uncharacterized protein n=1 Tax=Talaromyces stipitatus (strain ATCC 10500 / CBS 375.48 / QM 6759 / NRRL 1006) TaxID=441959 RepID=B8MKI5_TALSN|nr:uncharacterized protein TSTA_047860 [Talaromyces stipitatus ATCC 10500]EED15340.1 hypothetical protein TSTA_047860 [Talaromyces stipitatus ATCC 10500]
MLNADPQRETPFERMKSSIAEAMQPGDTKSTLHRLPPDEQESILPLKEDEKPLYGQRQSTEFSGIGSSSSAGATTSKKDQGMMASAGEMVGKALGRK